MGQLRAQTLLQSIMALWLGQDQLDWFEAVDWDQAVQSFTQETVDYPPYYTGPDVHGIPGGYLNPIAALTYDPVTAIASPPHEGWLRHQAAQAIMGQPQTILDLGCGTGTATLLLQQQFPQATVIGLDLSPLMLVMADRKARQAQQSRIQWRHGLAEATSLEGDRFDLITLSFLLHELPPEVSQSVLNESLRLLKPGGQLLILDGSQPVLRRLGWVIDLFREPYSKSFAQGCLIDWLATAGFTATSSNHLGLIHRVTTGVRP